MNIPFFNRPTPGKINSTTDEADKAARLTIEGILRDLPDLIMTYVADIETGRVLASYTSHRQHNPNQVSLRNAKILAQLHKTTSANPWLGGPVLDISDVLNEQLHHIRPFQGGKWYCFVAALVTDVNLGVLKDIVRRHTS